MEHTARPDHFDVAVIGTGSGNSIPGGPLEGKRIAVVEEGTFGGTCINVGCIPTKMFVYAAEIAETTREGARLGVDAEVTGVRWLDIRDRIFGRIDGIVAGGKRYRQSGGNGVTLFQGHGEFAVEQPDDGTYRLTVTSGVDAGKSFTADQVVLSSGSRAVVPDQARESGVPFHTSDTVMRIEAVPRRLTIIGAGYIAAELGHVFGALGAQVSIVARSNSLLMALDPEMSKRFTKAATAKWNVHLGRTIDKVEGDHSEQRVTLDNGQVVHSDLVLIATGRVPNSDRLGLEHVGVEVADDGVIVVDTHQQTSVDRIWALGDVANRYQLKHVANHEERVVQHNVAHYNDRSEWVESDHRFVPSAVFTHPQLAQVGQTEKEALENGYDVACATQEFGGTAYGWAMEDTTSVCKVIADKKTGLLLGAQLIGPQSSVLIQPLIQAMSFGLPVKDMARGQYWIHPALTEVVENALLALEL
ncbi:mycothione reductase [Jatrophihabitans sp. YIM 134969]